MLLASCGSSGSSGPEATSEVADGVESGLPASPHPTRGGQLVYGLEAESDGGFCLPEAQLVTSGIQVARAFYDPLVVPDDEGDYVPYLAKSVDHDGSYRTWTITLRAGISFTDGTKLDATVVKNNLDAYRGEYPGRSSVLFQQVFANIASIEVRNELTLRVHTKEPWVAFPASLYGAGRVLIVGQKQLDAPTASCQRNLIGTGPFRFVSWEPNASLRGTRNTSYWQTAPDGEPYPYLDAVEFRPIPNSDARIAALQGGEINMMHTSTPADMSGTLRALRDNGAINLLVSTVQTESEYLIVNTSGTGGANPILSDASARRAIAQAIDKKAINDAANQGWPQLANGPFPPGVLGHLDDTGEPAHDPAAAKKTVAALKAKGASTKLRLLTGTSPAFVAVSAAEKRMLEAVGFEVTITTVDEARLVDEVLAGNYDLSSMRNQPGDDPDANEYWWRGGDNLLNFGRFSDDVIDENLQIGRTDPDPEVRKKAYETISRRFAEQQYNIYLWWAPWAIAEAANVHGILGPDLPDGQKATKRIVSGHPMLGIWIDQS
jgi:peptide/nickel transport system substrate-binding protein